MQILPSKNLQQLPGSNVPILFGKGSLQFLPRELLPFGSRALVVSDPGLAAAGHVDHVMQNLAHAGITAQSFTDLSPNPTTDDVARGLALAQLFQPNVLVALGGGSAMDSAKGINFLLTNGGQMSDYWGVDKASRPMLPLIAIPTTAGTGSDAQSAALITDALTHRKMACLDKKVLPRFAILDPTLLITCPRPIRAATALDALAHAVETSAASNRNETSRAFSLSAWALLCPSFGAYVQLRESPDDRDAMLLGAHLAGAAVENSMLGSAHACANPLTELFGLNHGIAVSVMLPHVIRFNSALPENHYSDLGESPEALIDILYSFLAASGIPTRLALHDVTPDSFEKLAAAAAQQWTAKFNPRPMTPADFLSLYQNAW